MKECIRCGWKQKELRKYGNYGCNPGWGAYFKRHDYSKPLPFPKDGLLIKDDFINLTNITMNKETKYLRSFGILQKDIKTNKHRHFIFKSIGTIVSQDEKINKLELRIKNIQSLCKHEYEVYQLEESGSWVGIGTTPLGQINFMCKICGHTKHENDGRGRFQVI